MPQSTRSPANNKSIGSIEMGSVEWIRQDRGVEDLAYCIKHKCNQIYREKYCILILQAYLT